MNWMQSKTKAKRCAAAIYLQDSGSRFLPELYAFQGIGVSGKSSDAE
jgi:hypothetical protein